MISSQWLVWNGRVQELTEEFMPGFGEEGGAAAAATAADMDVDLVFSQTTPPIPEPQNSPLEPPFSPNSTSGGESPASYCGDFSGEEADASFDDVPVQSPCAISPVAHWLV